MGAIIRLNFDPDKADHRRAARWLVAQSDPAEAVVRLIQAASEGQRRLKEWEELARLLADDLKNVRDGMSGQPVEPKPKPEIREDPESARRLDSLFK
jgi:hypothetical protein